MWAPRSPKEALDKPPRSPFQAPFRSETRCGRGAGACARQARAREGWCQSEPPLEVISDPLRGQRAPTPLCSSPWSCGHNRPTPRPGRELPPPLTALSRGNLPPVARRTGGGPPGGAGGEQGRFRAVLGRFRCVAPCRQNFVQEKCTGHLQGSSGDCILSLVNGAAQAAPVTRLRRRFQNPRLTFPVSPTGFTPRFSQPSGLSAKGATVKAKGVQESGGAYVP
jgi:hypothetical protein